MEGLAFRLVDGPTEPGAPVQEALDYAVPAQRFKLLAHPVRLRILDILRRQAECVCHIEAVLGKPQPYVSQQLRYLRQAGLIRAERQGTNIFYHLADPQVEAILELVLGPVPADTEHDCAGYSDSCPCPRCSA